MESIHTHQETTAQIDLSKAQELIERMESGQDIGAFSPSDLLLMSIWLVSKSAPDDQIQNARKA